MGLRRSREHLSPVDVSVGHLAPLRAQASTQAGPVKPPAAPLAVQAARAERFATPSLLHPAERAFHRPADADRFTPTANQAFTLPRVAANAEPPAKQPAAPTHPPGFPRLAETMEPDPHAVPVRDVLVQTREVTRAAPSTLGLFLDVFV